MDWTPNGSDQDIEDRRDESGGGGGGFGGFGGPGFGGSGFGGIHLGIGGVLVVGVLSLFFHQNLFSVFSGGSTDSGPVSSAPYRSPIQPGATSEGNSTQDSQEKPEYQFIRFVLMTCKPIGTLFFQPKRTGSTATPSWCYTAANIRRLVEKRRSRSGRFIVPAIRKSTLILGS